MNIIDLHDPLRVDRIPDAVEVLLSSGNFIQDNFIISKLNYDFTLKERMKNWVSFL